jgi:hypothetical protein
LSAKGLLRAAPKGRYFAPMKDVKFIDAYGEQVVVSPVLEQLASVYQLVWLSRHRTLPRGMHTLPDLNIVMCFRGSPEYPAADSTTAPSQGRLLS